MKMEIYWEDLSEKIQNELLAAGYDNTNVTKGIFPVTTIHVDTERE